MAVKVLHCYMLLFVYVTFLANMHAYLYDCVGPSRNNQSVPRLFLLYIVWQCRVRLIMSSTNNLLTYLCRLFVSLN